MKKLLAVLIPCMMLFVGCSSGTEPSEDKAPDVAKYEENVENPPSLTVTLPHGSLDGTIQKYDWTYTNKEGSEKNEVKTVMDESELANGAAKTTAAAGENMMLKFSVAPTSYEVKMVLPSTMNLEVMDNEVSLPIPTNKGKATFRVDATFKQGMVTYMFNLDIEG